MPLCADSKLYYERYRPYSLIDGELASAVSEVDDSVDQLTTDTDQLMLTDDSQFTLCLISTHSQRVMGSLF